LVPTIPDIPEGAALAATGSSVRAAALRYAMEQARQRQAAQTQIVGSSGVARAGRMALAAFFCFHYGMFWFVHGIFIFTLPRSEAAGAVGGSETPSDRSVGRTSRVAARLFLSHGASFLFNYIGRGEYVTRTPAARWGALRPRRDPAPDDHLRRVRVGLSARRSGRW
jgi:hypothetical protein